MRPAKIRSRWETQRGLYRHARRFVKIAQEGKARLVFLGDSITKGWGSRQDIWEKAFGTYQPVSFGIGGDRTQHMLWRIMHGELDGIKPKAVVLMIGTNNSGSDTADGIARGISAIVKTIRSKQPQPRILLLDVFPRGEQRHPNPARDKLAKLNKLIAKLPDGRLCVTYGHRRKPAGMRARISADEGKTWQPEIVIRDDGFDGDLGYPRSLVRPDGRLFTAYYYNGPREEDRCIEGTFWTPPTGLY